MFPDLSYLLHFLIGTQPDNWTSIFKTFGLMLVLAILSAAWILYLELKRKANEGLLKPQKVKMVVGKPASTWELISNGIFGFILGFKLLYVAQNFPEFQVDPAAVILSSKGIWWAGLLLAGVFAYWRYWEKKKEALPKPKEVTQTMYPHDRIGDITIVAAITGILGARLFSILEEPSIFFSDPLGTLLSGSGLTVYGGFIMGYFGVAWYLKKLKIPFLHFADAVAPALIIAYGVGRIGCQLAGDGDWGIVAAAMPEWWFLADWMWAYEFPSNVNNVGELIAACDPDCWAEIKNNYGMSTEMKCQQCCGINYCHELSPKVYPTPFYETIFSFMIGGFLWAIRKRITIPGMIFFIYLILNGIERFWIEKIRVNVNYEIFGMEITQAELISTAVFLLGVIGVLVLWRRSKKGK